MSGVRVGPWIKSPTARRILVHWADARPAWLWSQDGERLIWRNDAARFFQGRVKKRGLKLAPEAVPIKGQIARLIRLGSAGRSSLSRIQFLAGDRPVSTTCSCTPLELDDGKLALLIVGVDPIEPELLERPESVLSDPVTLSLFPAASEYLVVSDDSQVIAGSSHALEAYAPAIESEGLPMLAGDSAIIDIAGERRLLTRYRASQHDALLLMFEPPEAEAAEPAGADLAASAEPPEPELPLGLAPIASKVAPSESDEERVEAEAAVEARQSLSSLFDRLAEDSDLYGPLSAADEHYLAPPPAAETAIVTAEPAAAVPDDPIGEIIAAEIAVHPQPPPAPAPTLWRIVGRGFAPLALPAQPLEQVAGPLPTVVPEGAPEPVAATINAAPEAEADAADDLPDREAVERTSRYNFDELSRILAERVNAISTQQWRPTADKASDAPASENALVNLAGETFILNRLPLGILVFREQQVIFANRALIDLTGHESLESLRAAGLTSIFPAEGAANAGPVTHLVARDGRLLAVNARLQSIAWHGRPALMLSAGLAESRPGHEYAVKTFAQLSADLRDEGYVIADRAGVVSEISLPGRVLLGRGEDDIVGRPLTALVEPAADPELKRFLARPARFAETARPGVLLAGTVSGTELLLFAEGQAGIVSGYFGFIRRAAAGGTRPPPPERDDAALLARISRDIREPLNTIVGFADLIGSAAFGPGDNGRYAEYARDIGAAGLEIAGLVDQIADYSRLTDTGYQPDRSDVDLVALLTGSVRRVRMQAAARRVLVRTAISEQLPRISADEGALSQAVLNLLGSAVEQTPPGGSVILSAQREDDGDVVVNLRDRSEKGGDPGERFVVLREGPDGAPTPVRSSMGLALTRSLLAASALQLSVDANLGAGTLFSLKIPAALVLG